MLLSFVNNSRLSIAHNNSCEVLGPLNGLLSEVLTSPTNYVTVLGLLKQPTTSPVVITKINKFKKVNKQYGGVINLLSPMLRLVEFTNNYNSALVVDAKFSWRNIQYRYFVFNRLGKRRSLGLWSAILEHESYDALNSICVSMEKQNHFKHKVVVRSITSSFPKYLIKPSNALGLVFIISGKISVSGNARTRTMWWAGGVFSHSRLHQNGSYSFNIIRTLTGVLGVHLFLTF